MYSPSFDGGMTGIGSCSLIVAVIVVVAGVGPDQARHGQNLSYLYLFYGYSNLKLCHRCLFDFPARHVRPRG